MRNPSQLFLGKIKSLGGVVEFSHEIPKEFQSPFERNVGIDYSEKKLWVHVRRNTLLESYLLSLIHEAGHVFASHVPPKEVESDFAFLGWELAFAKEIDYYENWLHNLQSYGIPGEVLRHVTPWAYFGQEDEGFDRLDDEAQEAILEHIVEYADIQGLVVDGKAISIR